MALPSYYVEKTRFGRQKARIKLEGLDNYSLEQVKSLVEAGSRFFLFRYAFFLVFLYLNRTSPIYFVRDKKADTYKKKQRFYSLVCGGIILVTLLFFIIGLNAFQLFDPAKEFSFNAIIFIFIGLGLYIPLAALWVNLRGGEDVTRFVLAYLDLFDTAERATGTRE
jgi:hypothetical protein